MIRKNSKKILMAVTLSCLFTPVFAEKLMKVETVNGKALYYKQYEANELTSIGCDPGIYTGMVNDYLKQRGAAHNLEYQARTIQGATQAPTASASGSTPGAGSCIENAANQINNAASKISKIFDIFNGGSIDFSSLATNIGNQLLNGACQEVNRVTGQLTNNALNNSGINNGLNTVGGIAGGGIGTQVGIGNTNIPINAGTILNSGNNPTGQTNLNNGTNLNTGGGVGTQNTGTQNNNSGNSGYMCSWLGINC